MAKFKPFKFDPIDELGIEVPKNKQKEALEEVATYLQEELLSYYGDANSPVSGGHWTRKLTKAYKELKGEQSSSDIANLELTGDLLDSFTVEADGSKIVVDVGSDQYGKAEGHITGQYGDGKMKKDYRRQFIPQKNETFKRQIISNIRRILKEYEDDGEN